MVEVLPHMLLEIIDKEPLIIFPNGSKYLKQDMKFWAMDLLRGFLYDDWNYNPVNAYNAKEVKDFISKLKPIIKELQERALILAISNTHEEFLINLLA